MNIDRDEVARLIDELLQITKRLTALTNRSFAPDGHLVGSIGEVIAANAYGLELTPHSEKGCDALKDGKRIEIKATYGDRVAFRTHAPDHVLHHCLVLKLNSGLDFEEVYNGPSEPVLNAIMHRKLPSNGQIAVSLSKLRSLNSNIQASDRLNRVNR